MLLSDTEERELYHASGVWQDKRLDQILLTHAKDRPDALGFVDDSDLHDICGREPQCLTFDQAYRRTVGLAGFLSSIGVKSDTVIAMLLPPCVDASLLILAASRAGLVVAPLPLSLGEADLKAQLEAVGAKAVVCCSRYEDEPVAERVRNVAAEMFSIRFVFCLGDDIPDGLVELAPMLEGHEELDEDALSADGFDHGADDILAVQWTTATNHPSAPVGRSHNQILAASRFHAAQINLGADQCLFMTHHWSGLSGLSAAFGAALYSGARIQFHHFTHYPRMAAHLAEFGGQHVMLPAHQWEMFHCELSDQVREQLLSVSLVWNRIHTSGESFRGNETAARLVDLTIFNELALFSQIRRKPGFVGPIPLGAIKTSDEDGSKVWLETDLFGLEEAKAQFDASLLGGELCVKGPMVPRTRFPEPGEQDAIPLPASRKGHVHCDVGCRVTDQQDEQVFFSPLGDLSDVIRLGGFAERAQDLDGLYQSCEGIDDAAVFTRRDQSGDVVILAALVVGDPGYALADFHEALSKAGISSHKWPEDILVVDEVPRRDDGSVLRTSLQDIIKTQKVA
ncbi:MAG: acyl--CoA ligase [Cohaesibacter sp.]|jgi:acyl-CoA synthetase (AMP-forming)/AMP-acid ligase II|nr:acyl--CoA ligase [Cohaesibacter sp.]